MGIVGEFAIRLRLGEHRMGIPFANSLVPFARESIVS
jgi:hypothetical protein